MERTKTKIVTLVVFLLLRPFAHAAGDFGTTVKGPIKEMLADIMEIVVDLGWVMIVILGLVGVYIAKTNKQNFPSFLGFSALAIGFWLVCLTSSKKGL